MYKTLLIIIFVAISLGAGLAQYSHGREYPTRPIELVVGYGAGGSNDLTARLIADVTKKYLGQPVVVVNKVGSGNTVAVSDVINSKPDGYKIIYLPNNYFALTIKTQKIPFDPSNIIPLVNFVEMKQGLVVRSDSSWKTIGQLLDYARQNPGKLKWNHAGRGIGSHISPALFFRKAGVETIDIPYKSSPDLLSALLGGHADASSLLYAAGGKAQLRAGTIRYLVFFANQRYTDPSDVPCSAELGFPERIIIYGGIYVHKDTPEDIKKTLFVAFEKTHEDPEFRKGMEIIGDEIRFERPEFIKASIIKLEEGGVPILKELGLYIER